MPADTYELSDISVKYRSDNSLNGGSSKNGDGGMYISTAKAFILAFLAIAIAVGVGIIVHFAGPARDFECSCTYPTSAPVNDGGTTAALEQCKEWATGGNDEICKSIFSVFRGVVLVSCYKQKIMMCNV